MLACNRCVFTSRQYANLTLDSSGICQFCKGYDQSITTRTIASNDRPAALEGLVKKLKRAGRMGEYDCVIGLSGGVDSSYVALKTRELGLRALAVHVDNGWDTELAVSNIQRVVEALKLDFVTIVLDWDEFKALQVAFLKAGTPDVDVPSDHAIQAAMWQTACQHRVKYILSGMNYATESVFPAEWAQGHSDWTYIRSIARAYGVRLRTYPHYSLASLLTYGIRGKTIVSLLNYMGYDKPAALEELKAKVGFRPYGSKHFESRYTRFVQGSYLRQRFGIDKRYAHLSSLILSGSISREEALTQLQSTDYPEEMARDDGEFVRKKLELDMEEWKRIMNAPVKSIKDYPNSSVHIDKLKRLVNSLRQRGLYAR